MLLLMMMKMMMAEIPTHSKIHSFSSIFDPSQTGMAGLLTHRGYVVHSRPSTLHQSGIGYSWYSLHIHILTYRLCDACEFNKGVASRECIQKILNSSLTVWMTIWTTVATANTGCTWSWVEEWMQERWTANWMRLRWMRREYAGNYCEFLHSQLVTPLEFNENTGNKKQYQIYVCCTKTVGKDWRSHTCANEE